jgi:NAD(P)-dependent dehydrogenase (short-subunit alcohol dehydrogenase family)
MVGFTRALAREVGDDNICVNAIAPGLTLSGSNDAGLSEEYLAGRVRQRCLKRNQVPEDLVGIVLFLCSPQSDFITGQTFVVDGGTIMR